MGKTKSPKRLVAGHEAERDEWVAAVEALVAEVEGWASGWQDWATRRVPKTISEDPIGTYTVPQLIMQCPAGRMLLDPVSRYVAGDRSGLIDLYAMPSFDAARLVRDNGVWGIHLFLTKKPVRRKWTERAFLKTAAELFEFNG
ncbi:MAG: hypothetical protein U0746_10740 [Gemmataceae bacterium]